MHQSDEKASKQGNYTSLTYQMMMPGSDAIIEVYQRVKHIEGLIAL
jgi:putative lipoic acid-binding regulatory protein